jgi:hypothetical protein
MNRKPGHYWVRRYVFSEPILRTWNGSQWQEMTRGFGGSHRRLVGDEHWAEIGDQLEITEAINGRSTKLQS